MSKNGCYVNIDPDVLGYVYHGVKGDFSNLKEKLDLYLEGYKGYGISDLIFNIFAQNSIVPSDNVGWLYNSYNLTEEDGKPVNYKGETHVHACYMAYNEMEDPIGYMIEESKKHYNVWLSYRMNDCHWSHAETAPGRCEQLYYYAKHNNKFIGDHVANRYYGECLDYADENIRNVMLAYIKETLYRYKPCGIELDFLREPFCFDYENIPNATEIMTEFIANVKAIITEYEKEFGGKVKLLVRLTRDIENNRIFGFDVKEWIKRGLVDILSPCSRWQSTDSDMPISKWKELCQGTNVEIAAGLEFYLWSNIKVDEASAKGLASQYFDDGADKIYLYNYYREAVKLPDMTGWNKAHPSFSLFNETADNTDDADAWDMERLSAIDSDKTKIWKATENLASAKSGTRRHVLTFTEPCLVPKGGTPFSPLPFTVEGKATLEKLTGNITDGKVTLFLGITKNATPPTVTVDGYEAKLIGKSDDAYFAHPECDGNPPERFAVLDYYAYEPRVDLGNVRRLEFFADSLKVEYLEFKVEA